MCERREGEVREVKGADAAGNTGQGAAIKALAGISEHGAVAASRVVPRGRLVLQCGREGLWQGEFLVIGPRRVRLGGGPVLGVPGRTGAVGDKSASV